MCSSDLLSEKQEFQKALAAAGIVFIGPDARAIHAMGDKIESKKLAQKAGVSTVPGWLHALKNADEVAKFVVDKYGEGLKLDNQLLELKRETPLIQTDFTKQKGLMWMDRAVWQSGHDILLNRTKQLEKAVPVDDVMTLEILEKIGKIGG